MAKRTIQEVEFVEMEDVKIIQRHPLLGRIITAFANHRKQEF